MNKWFAEYPRIGRDSFNVLDVASLGRSRNCNISSRREISHAAVCRQKESIKKRIKVKSDNSLYRWCCIVLCVILAVGYAFFRHVKSSDALTLQSQISLLKREFPSQISESWKRILNALEFNDVTAKSLLLLHGDDQSTCDCLVHRLASIHKKHTNSNEFITYQRWPKVDIDYGVILQHYRPLVKEHKIFVVNLNTVSGSTARIFHSLCDETYPDGNPPLFIFTLKDINDLGKQKPFGRAETILKEAWKELPENEINPLISRIVRNVVFVKPEETNICLASKKDC